MILKIKKFIRFIFSIHLFVLRTQKLIFKKQKKFKINNKKKSKNKNKINP